MKAITIAMILVFSLILCGRALPEEVREVESIDLTQRDGITYVKGEDTPFTGKRVKFHKNGRKKWEADYLEGKKHGKFTMWRKDGQKRMEVHYQNGKKHGKSTIWRKNGEKFGEATYKHGKLISKTKF